MKAPCVRIQFTLFHSFRNNERQALGRRLASEQFLRLGTASRGKPTFPAVPHAWTGASPICIRPGAFNVPKISTSMGNR
jgi:hypothetical protein